MSTTQHNRIATEKSPRPAKMSEAPKYPLKRINQTPAKWAVGMWAYWKKDRNDKGELTGRKLYISEAKYHAPSKPGAHYTDDKWTYFLRDGPGEKAQGVEWAEEGDLKLIDPRYEHGVPPLIDFSP